MAASPRLLDQVRQAARLRHLSRRTEKAYLGWIRRFILFHGKRHPRQMGVAEITAFLSHLAVAGNVSASTQNQALSALLFLYRHILNRDPGRLEGIVRARRSKRLPVVLSRREVGFVLQRLAGVHHLVGSLLYGTGLRLSECLRLRVKDLDFEYRQIAVRQGKGNCDRTTMLPRRLEAELKRHLRRLKTLHCEDLKAGYAGDVMIRETRGRDIEAACGMLHRHGARGAAEGEA